jgi:hypothetical protein
MKLTKALLIDEWKGLYEEAVTNYLNVTPGYSAVNTEENRRKSMHLR